MNWAGLWLSFQGRQNGPAFARSLTGRWVRRGKHVGSGEHSPQAFRTQWRAHRSCTPRDSMFGYVRTNITTNKTKHLQELLGVAYFFNIHVVFFDDGSDFRGESVHCPRLVRALTHLPLFPGGTGERAWRRGGAPGHRQSPPSRWRQGGHVLPRCRLSSGLFGCVLMAPPEHLPQVHTAPFSLCQQG